MNLNSISSIIFDFGGVVLNLDEHKTYTAMCNLLDCNHDEMIEKLHKDNIFFDFECGKISSELFIEHVKSIAKKPIQTQEIKNAWNAMLLDLPLSHVEVLLKIKPIFRTFLLSNTNAIHEEAFVEGIKNQGIPYSLHDLFENVWYSHDLGLRKPNHDIFEEVMRQANLKPEETLFLDDRHDNISAAQQLGIHTQLITKEKSILSIFEKYV